MARMFMRAFFLCIAVLAVAAPAADAGPLELLGRVGTLTSLF